MEAIYWEGDLPDDEVDSFFFFFPKSFGGDVCGVCAVVGPIGGFPLFLCQRRYWLATLGWATAEHAVAKSE